MDYCDTRYLPAAQRLMTGRDKPESLEGNREKLAEAMRFMEHEGLRKLGGGPFWLGSTPTLVDFHYLPFFERFAVYEELAGARWPEDCTRLRQCFESLSQRPSYLATRHSLDFHLDQQRRFAALAAARRS
jgi:glutathione S-transferase